MFLLPIEDHIRILLRVDEFRTLRLDLPVLRILCLAFLDQPGSFCIQSLHSRQFRSFRQLIKGSSCSLLQFDLCPVQLIEFCLLCFRQPLIFQVDFPGLAVIEDVLPECFDLLDPGILFFDRRKQLLSAGYSFIGHAFQFFMRFM